MVKPKYYESTPATLAVSLIPLFTSDTRPGTLAVTSCSSGDIRVDELGAFEKDTEGLLRKCKDQCRHGHHTAVLQLVNINPAFMLDEWVAETWLKLHKNGFFSRCRGRPFGSAYYHPLIVVGLVEWMINSGQARNKDEAFGKLEELCFFSYETAKKTYYNALGNRNIRILLLKKDKESRKLSQEDYEKLRQSACIPEA
jgi:hypothetical protein